MLAKNNSRIVIGIIRKDIGSAVVFSLVGVLLIGFVGAYFAVAYASLQAAQARANFFNLVSQTQLNIRNTVNSDASWQATASDVAENATSCFNTIPKSCAASATTFPFVLWPAGTTSFSNKSNAVYDGTDPTAGYALDGSKCSGTGTGFSLSGNPNCPIHIDLNWSTPSGCPSGNCVVVINANVLFRPGSTSPIGPINEQKLALSFIQATIGGTELCSGQPLKSVIDTCAAPPYPQDKIFCLPAAPGGWGCGQVYY